MQTAQAKITKNRTNPQPKGQGIYRAIFGTKKSAKISCSRNALCIYL